MVDPLPYLTLEQNQRAWALGQARIALGYRRPLLGGDDDEVDDGNVQQLLLVAEWILGNVDATIRPEETMRDPEGDPRA